MMKTNENLDDDDLIINDFDDEEENDDQYDRDFEDEDELQKYYQQASEKIIKINEGAKLEHQDNLMTSAKAQVSGDGSTSSGSETKKRRRGVKKTTEYRYAYLKNNGSTKWFHLAFPLANVWGPDIVQALCDDLNRIGNADSGDLIYFMQTMVDEYKVIGAHGGIQKYEALLQKFVENFDKKMRTNLQMFFLNLAKVLFNNTNFLTSEFFEKELANQEDI